MDYIWTGNARPASSLGYFVQTIIGTLSRGRNLPQQTRRTAEEGNESLYLTSRLAQIKIAHRIREGRQEYA